VARRNVEKAIELIFRGGAVVIQVHPDDALEVKKAIAEEPRWAEGFDSVQVRAATDVGRGGCRLISGAGTVDMTLQTQLELLQSALEGALDAPWLEDSGGAVTPSQGISMAPAGRGESP
jgi:flagellar biosynthesis/type III secretory pathway protein FliH